MGTSTIPFAMPLGYGSNRESLWSVKVLLPRLFAGESTAFFALSLDGNRVFVGDSI